jgi:hypothetical protein
MWLILSDLDEVSSLRSEVSLLRLLILFERQRRETLGLRNRRLLGRTKSSRILEEQNTALSHKLELVEGEVGSLLTQLETLRREKHEAEETRAMASKQRDQQVQAARLPGFALLVGTRPSRVRRDSQ